MLEVLDPVQWLAREQLPRGLVERFDMSAGIEGEQRAWRIVDDRPEVARFRALLRVARLQSLQRKVESLPKHVEDA
ncbi:MAG: hypothetical protein HOP95_08010, partial [Sphingomonas sp.]|nr:hypothetical protein [Sphingomonas sp.]